MNFKPWLTDPATKVESVTLTFFSLAAITYFAAGIAEVVMSAQGMQEIKTGALEDFLWTTAALYFGRRFSVKGKDFDGSPKQDGGTPS